MAKPTTVKIKLVSSADTGFFYVTKKNPRNITEKMSFRKYDPVAESTSSSRKPRSSRRSLGRHPDSIRDPALLLLAFDRRRLEPAFAGDSRGSAASCRFGRLYFGFGLPPAPPAVSARSAAAASSAAHRLDELTTEIGLET